MLTASRSRVAAPAITYYDNPRAARLAEEHRKLERSTLDYITASPDLAALGPDPLMQQIVAAKGLTDVDVLVLRALVGSRLVTLLVAPTRVWRDTYGREALLQARREAFAMGTRCIIVPQRWIRGTLRASIARTIARCRNVHYSNLQLTAVLEHVREFRISTVRECAANVVGHEDPVGVILLMCQQGVLDIDRSCPVSADSWISTKHL